MANERPAAPPIVRVPHPEISLWQSAVREVIADRLAGGDLNSATVREHPLARATDADAYDHYRTAVASNQPIPHPTGLARILELAHEAHSTGILTELTTILAAARAYSDHDPGFIVECIPRFISWYLQGRRPEYRDWRVEGGGDMDFGVVEYRLPADARVAVIGDWGTGMDDARALLLELLSQGRPTALVHLGDIYYSGTRREVARNFDDVLNDAFREVPPRIPVFNIPGNHDYYSGGRGFYSLLDRLNDGPARQSASYFCLRSEDARWQLVGIDTGFNDRVPAIAYDPFYEAPRLQDSEAEWLGHKLAGFAGSTVLLSHHQLYSAHSALNGARSGRPRLNFNDRLYDVVRPHLDRIAAWMWGHEHSLGIFEDGQHGLAKGRLVGCSAFETSTTVDPYATHFNDVAYQQPQVRLTLENGWYDHGFAIIDLAESAVEYYQFPSWSNEPPASLRPAALIHHEPLATTSRG